MPTSPPASLVLTTACLCADQGQPLPFIYNPLLERFLKPPEVLASGRQLGYGYELQLGDEDFEGLPQHVDFKTISSLDYLRFSSGVSQAYALINVRFVAFMTCCWRQWSLTSFPLPADSD